VTRPIDVRSGRKVYGSGSGRVLALDGVTFSVAAGEFVSVLGPSGCGKSTLLWAMAGLKPLDAGSVELGGEHVSGPNRGISIMFQQPTLLPWRSTLDNILLPLELRAPRDSSARDRVRRLIERVGLGGFADRSPRASSRSRSPRGRW
jgi:NitT/TauT family transport system ATP-binding protein